MPKLRDLSTIQSRLYTRSRGGPLRHYADFRDFEDVGGGQDALTPPGERHATTDPSEAERLANALLKEYTARRAAEPTVLGDDRQFSRFADHHLEQKALNEDARPQWMESAERHLATACAYFGPATDLAEIKVRWVSDYIKHLRSRSNGRGGTMASGSIVHYLNSLSNMFDRAISEGIIPLGHNPVSALMSKPKIKRKPTAWLEIPEVAEILAFAKTYQPTREDLAIPYFYPILAGYPLTGCRESELLGLEVDDVNLERQVLRIRPNAWRELKTENSDRSIHIPSQLAEIWAAYLNGPNRPTGRLLFPALRSEGDEEYMISDIRKALDKMPMPARFARKRTPHEMKKVDDARLAMLARWDSKQRGPKPRISREELQKPVSSTVVPPLRTTMLRHTYCAARLQTLDRGEPISVWTVADEMGHEDIKMIKKVYGHLGKIRHRGTEVEYR